MASQLISAEAHQQMMQQQYQQQVQQSQQPQQSQQQQQIQQTHLLQQQPPLSGLSFNQLIPSSATSPTASSVMNLNTFVDSSTRRGSIKPQSPINLSTGLNGLTISDDNNNNSLKSNSFTIRIRNLPNDLTLREAYCIFTFAKDFLNLELFSDSSNNLVLLARFTTLSSASNYSHFLESNRIFGPTYPFYLKVELIDDQQLQQQPQEKQSINTPTASSSATTNNASQSGKRPSVGNQKSRFLFSDPFGNEPIHESIIESNSSITNNNGLGMRDPWQGVPQTAPGEQQLHHTQRSYQPQPQSLNPSNSAGSLLNGPTAGPVGQFSTPQTPSLGDWDRSRRSNSAFFNGPSANSVPNTGNAASAPNNNSNGNNNNSNNNSSTNPTPSPLLTGQLPNGLMPSHLSLNNGSGGNNSTSNTTSQTNSQIDISLLARVPPPVNPADQNPPCNTLYVGNLPPDATESELRELFSPQKGFRRLSFKNKNQVNSNNPNSSNSLQNNNSHGPMCFVEFEDANHATMALADLYGCQLPRHNGAISTKGGIRLSYSKNPLGVRGPGPRRNSNFNYPGNFTK